MTIFDTMATALGEVRAHLELLATIDPLLNIANRRKFDNEENLTHEDGIGGRVTVSIGVAVAVPDANLSSQDLVDAADRVLYAAKDAGRDKVEATSLIAGLNRAGSNA